ncbi:MAG: hypothetical protein AAF557_12155 [Pseudomonadota bacterium]
MTPYDDTKSDMVDTDEADLMDGPRTTPNQLRRSDKGHEYYEVKNAIRRAAQRRQRTRRMASFRR